MNPTIRQEGVYTLHHYPREDMMRLDNWRRWSAIQKLGKAQGQFTFDQAVRAVNSVEALPASLPAKNPKALSRKKPAAFVRYCLHQAWIKQEPPSV